MDGELGSTPQTPIPASEAAVESPTPSGATAPHAPAVDTLAELYDRHASVVYPLLLRMLRSPDEAQDVLQETFLQAWRNQASFDTGRGNAAAWLIAIARSRAIDRLRARTRRQEREEEAAREIYRSATVVDHREYAELNQLRRTVKEAMSELPYDQRTALELAYFEGLSQSEIADRLEQPLGTVKTRIRLAMQKLRERLKASMA